MIVSFIVLACAAVLDDGHVPAGFGGSKGGGENTAVGGLACQDELPSYWEEPGHCLAPFGEGRQVYGAADLHPGSSKSQIRSAESKRMLDQQS